MADARTTQQRNPSPSRSSVLGIQKATIRTGDGSRGDPGSARGHRQAEQPMHGATPAIGTNKRICMSSLLLTCL